MQSVKKNTFPILRGAQPRQSYGSLHSTEDDWTPDPSPDPPYSSVYCTDAKLSKRHGSQVTDLETTRLKGPKAGTGPFTVLARSDIEAITHKLSKILICIQGSKECRPVVPQDAWKTYRSCSFKDENGPVVDAGANNNQNSNSNYHATSYRGSLHPNSPYKISEGSRSKGGSNKRGRGFDPPDDRDRKRSPSSPSTKAANSEDGLLFACPFQVHDPERFWCHGRKRIVDIRQHIDRKHRQELHCPNCGIPFDHVSTRDEHVREQSCQVSDAPFQYSGVTQEQWAAIRSRAASKKRRSDSERWFEMWDIIFPSSDRPASAHTQATVELDTRMQNMVSSYCDSPEIRAFIQRKIVDGFEEPARTQLHDYIQTLSRSLLHDFCYFVKRDGNFWRPTEPQGTSTAHSPADAPPGPISNGHGNPSIQVSPASSWSELHNPHMMPGLAHVPTNPDDAASLYPTLFDNTFLFDAEEGENMR